MIPCQYYKLVNNLLLSVYQFSYFLFERHNTLLKPLRDCTYLSLSGTLILSSPMTLLSISGS